MLDQPPLFRLFRIEVCTSNGSYNLFGFTFHNILLDNQSTTLIHSELIHYIENPSIELSLPTFQYIDFVKEVNISYYISI